MNNLDELVARLDLLGHLLPKETFLDPLHQSLGYAVVDICLQKGQTHFAHRVGEILLCQLSL